MKILSDQNSGLIQLKLPEDIAVSDIKLEKLREALRAFNCRVTTSLDYDPGFESALDARETWVKGDPGFYLEALRLPRDLIGRTCQITFRVPGAIYLGSDPEPSLFERVYGPGTHKIEAKITGYKIKRGKFIELFVAHHSNGEFTMKSIWSYLPRGLGGTMGDNISPYWTANVETTRFSTKPIERIWQILNITPLDQKMKLPKLKKEQGKSEVVRKGELILQITFPRQAKVTETGIDFTRTQAKRLRNFIDEYLRINTKLVLNFPTENTLVKGDASVYLNGLGFPEEIIGKKARITLVVEHHGKCLDGEHEIEICIRDCIITRGLMAELWFEEFKLGDGTFSSMHCFLPKRLGGLTTDLEEPTWFAKAKINDEDVGCTYYPNWWTERIEFL